jgi:hypothetical protein
MEHIEKYLHYYFPMWGIRFVGITDGVDTDNNANKKARQIYGLVNEWYCEDLSNSIRSAYKSKMKSGQYLGASCPYGYRKDPMDHNHLLVDDYAADVVRRIYSLYLQGYGKGRIASILTADHILIPTRYKQEVLGEHYQNGKALETTRNWSYQTVHHILNNQVYLGHLVQNKTNTISYKNKKKRSVPESEWIIVKNTHEAIIDVDVYEHVQAQQKMRTRNVPDENAENLFAGILYCADCKYAMRRKYRRRGDKESVEYICKTYKVYGKACCSSHKIALDVLEKTVLDALKKEVNHLLNEDDIRELKELEMDSEMDKKKQNENRLEIQIARMEMYKKKSYELLMEEIISVQEYQNHIREYDEKLSELFRKRERKLQTEDSPGEQNRLSRDVMLGLIRRIEVHENGTLDIYYLFGDSRASCSTPHV